MLRVQGRRGTSFLHHQGWEMLEMPASLPCLKLLEIAVAHQLCHAAVFGGRVAPCSALSPVPRGFLQVFCRFSANVLPWRLRWAETG